jgi:predicted nucleic acid-binding protein
VTIPVERLLIDTNVWILGLRRDERFPDCAALLDQLSGLDAVVPRQILKELNAHLSSDEMRDFYELVNAYPGHVALSWELAPVEKVKFYEARGCKKGDAVVAAHAEALGVKFVVTENRQFLRTVKERPFAMVTPVEILSSRLDIA